MPNEALERAMNAVERTWAFRCEVLKYTEEQELRAQDDYFHGAKSALWFIYPGVKRGGFHRWDHCLSNLKLVRTYNANPN